MTLGETLPDAIVYTETIVHSAPERYAGDAPYQIAIVDVDGQPRQMVRIITQSGTGRVAIGDRVRFVEFRNLVPVYEPIPA